MSRQTDPFAGDPAGPGVVANARRGELIADSGKLEWPKEEEAKSKPYAHEVVLVGERTGDRPARGGERPDCDFLFYVDGKPLGLMRSELERPCKPLGIPYGRNKAWCFMIPATRQSSIWLRRDRRGRHVDHGPRRSCRFQAVQRAPRRRAGRDGRALQRGLSRRPARHDTAVPAMGLRVDFDRRLKLEFHGATVTSDAGLLAFRELDDALGLTAMAAEVLADPRTGRNGRTA